MHLRVSYIVYCCKMALENKEEGIITTTADGSLEYLLLRGWCVPWVPGDSNENAELAAVLDESVVVSGGPQRRCVSAEEQAAGAEWLQAALESAAPRLLDIAVRNDDVDMFVALRPWSETLRRAQLLDSTECRSVWLEWTVLRSGSKLMLLLPSDRDTKEDAELRKAIEDRVSKDKEEESSSSSSSSSPPPPQSPHLNVLQLPHPSSSSALCGVTTLPMPSPVLCGWITMVALLTAFVVRANKH